jgi:DNA-binding transcriptional ArsR family regulator
MVEYMALSGNIGASDPLSDIFQALADATRRDILTRVAKKEMSISEIKQRYGLTFAAIAKHVKVLEKAKLVIKRRAGREQFVTMAPATIKTAEEALAYYQKLWEDRFDSLEAYLNKVQQEGTEK